MGKDEKWTCPTCKLLVATPFCPTCGEHALHTRELTLRALFEQLFEAFTKIDGRLLRSFRLLVTRPGALTVAYLKGQRKPYIGPVALFLIINVLFFAIESMTGGEVFATPLESHLEKQPWSEAVQGMVARRLEEKGTTLASYKPVFNQSIASKARSLIILMALAFSLAPALAFLRNKRPFMAHVVYSLHFYAFLLLLLCGAALLEGVHLWVGIFGLAWTTVDYTISLTLLIASAFYLHFSANTVYGNLGIIGILRASVLAIAVAAVLFGYRFALFLLTLYTV
jgi:hypothetical protein